jgi:hypothetical protein
VLGRSDGEHDSSAEGVAIEGCQRGGEDADVDIRRQVVEFVDRADGDRAVEAGGDVGEEGPSEAVAVPLDDRDRLRDAAEGAHRLLDVFEPPLAVDGQAHRHGLGR